MACPWFLQVLGHLLQEQGPLGRRLQQGALAKALAANRALMEKEPFQNGPAYPSMKLEAACPSQGFLEGFFTLLEDVEWECTSVPLPSPEDSGPVF